MTLEFSRQIFQQYPNIKFDKNPPVGAEMFREDGWADGQI